MYAGIFSVILLQSTPAIINVFAANNISVTNNNIQINNNNNNYETYSSKYVDGRSISGKTGDYEKSFYISDSYSWYKVWIQNTSDHDYTVDITNDSPVGNLLKSFKVKHRSAGYVILKRGKDGDKYVSVTSESGYPLSGSVAIREATVKSDLNDKCNL